MPDHKHNTTLHLCKDGSHTLYSKSFRQYYHNPNGAIAESRHVFFETPGWLQKLEGGNEHHLLEVGFGTGLNLLILLEELTKLEEKPSIVYHAVEAFPLSLKEVMNLNYPEKIELPNATEVMASIFGQLRPGENRLRINKQVSLELFCGPFDKWPQPDQPAGIVFFDPFSPDVNPDLWSRAVFQKLADWSHSQNLLATYGAASAARAAMAAAGWKVAKAPGALGKREMTLASLRDEPLRNWKRLNEERLRQRYERGDFTAETSG